MPSWEEKVLVLREILEDSIPKLLSSKDSLPPCDVAVIVYDSSSVPSAFVLWIMRELPPATMVIKREYSRIVAFIVGGSLCINHPNLFGGCEKLDVFWDKGLNVTNVSVTYKRPRPEWLSQKCLSIQICALAGRYRFIYLLISIGRK